MAELPEGVEVVVRPITDYIPNPDNPVVHPPDNEKAVKDSIERLGAGRSGLAREDVMLAGNLTLQEMIEAGITEVVEIKTDGRSWVVVNRPDLSPEEAAAMAIADQRGSELSRWSGDVLRELSEKHKLSLTDFFPADELRTRFAIDTERLRKQAEAMSAAASDPIGAVRTGGDDAIGYVDDEDFDDEAPAAEQTHGPVKEERTYTLIIDDLTFVQSVLVDRAMTEAENTEGLTKAQWLHKMAGVYLRGEDLLDDVE